jgi:hypothetical protein
MPIGIEVFPRLHVGSTADFVALESLWDAGLSNSDIWAVVHAAKEPYHRDFLGYVERAAPKDSPEYLFARRGNRLALNLIDVADVRFMPPELWRAAIHFLNENYEQGRNLLVHCNQGGSRAPSMALLWMSQFEPWRHLPFLEAEAKFLELYPAYAPAAGPRDFVKNYWTDADIAVEA